MTRIRDRSGPAPRVRTAAARTVKQPDRDIPDIDAGAVVRSLRRDVARRRAAQERAAGEPVARIAAARLLRTWRRALRSPFGAPSLPPPPEPPRAAGPEGPGSDGARRPAAADEAAAADAAESAVDKGNGARRRPRDPRTVAVLDMQMIAPAVGGSRIRLLGLFHGMGDRLAATYVGTYDRPGEKYRRHRLSDSLEEINVPLSPSHFRAAEAWRARAGRATVIDVSFPLLAHLSPDYVRAAREAAGAADIVVFSHPWVYPLVKDALAGARPLLVYDSHNMEGLLRTQLLDDGALGTALVRHAVAVEHELCHAADIILACSHEDRALFHRHYAVPFRKVKVLPNGAFTNALRPAGRDDGAALKRELGLGDAPLAVFVASSYPPNIEAASFIIDTLSPSIPDVTFAICGGVGDSVSAPPTGTGGAGNLRVTGSLSDRDLRKYLMAADLAINPMFSGSGTNVKMFDFMAAGLPIVTTPTGARGIAAGPEPAFLVRAADAFADGIRLLLADGDKAERMGLAGRRLAETSYSWERISERLGLLLHRSRRTLGRPVPFFSVIVPTYERHELLPDLMRCLQAQTFKDFEVIVLDQSGAPWQGSADHAGLDIVYVRTRVKGAVRARNAAAFLARGSVLAFTDDDCRPDPEWLDNAAGYFSDPAVVGVEGLIASGRLDDPNYRPVTNVGLEGIGFMTGNLFLRHEIFARIGGFDERFDDPHFREDTDLGWRALRHGAIPHARDVRVYHPPHPRDTARESLAERNRFFEKDALLMTKHPDRYRDLFAAENHHALTEGFWENFLRGVEKYGAELDDFYRERMPDHLKKSVAQSPSERRRTRDRA